MVLPIAENIPNNGQHFWAVPMSLPDAETLYRVRIRTMDNARSDMPAAFYIAKAKPSSGPPTVKVTAPGGPSQLGAGFTYPIRWTSTCGKSVNGPTDDAFDIELMNAAGYEPGAGGSLKEATPPTTAATRTGATPGTGTGR